MNGTVAPSSSSRTAAATEPAGMRISAATSGAKSSVAGSEVAVVMGSVGIDEGHRPLDARIHAQVDRTVERDALEGGARLLRQPRRHRDGHRQAADAARGRGDHVLLDAG